jgi:hypothetical protein
VEFRDGRFELEGGVRAMPVVEVEPGLEVSGALGRVEVSAGVGPFGKEVWMKRSGFALGARGVRACKEMAQAPRAAGGREGA